MTAIPTHCAICDEKFFPFKGWRLFLKDAPSLWCCRHRHVTDYMDANPESVVQIQFLGEKFSYTGEGV